VSIEWKNIAKESQSIKEMFDSISQDYDKLNDIMSFGLHRKIKKEIIKELTKCDKALDLCTGTGDVAAILKEKYKDAKIIGLDFSPNMIEIARKKHPDIEFLQWDCTQLPFEDESFDLCTVAFGLRNIPDLEKAVSEIYRVLKKDGIFINLDLGKPNRFFNLFLKPYMYVWVAILGKIFHGDETPYKYLAESNETFPAPAQLIEIYKNAGFSQSKNKNYLLGQIASQFSVK
jgi:demethylmenaquinone methyltransferase / 2-methoxy-6-polyprenyl-1,4-benzoquinol methylase